MKKGGVIQNWAIVLQPGYKITGYEAPEQIPYCLCGNIYNDERFADGEEITTSRIVEKIDEETFRSHSGTIYKVGKKKADYELFCMEYNSQP